MRTHICPPFRRGRSSAPRRSNNTDQRFAHLHPRYEGGPQARMIRRRTTGCTDIGRIMCLDHWFVTLCPRATALAGIGALAMRSMLRAGSRILRRESGALTNPGSRLAIMTAFGVSAGAARGGRVDAEFVELARGTAEFRGVSTVYAQCAGAGATRLGRPHRPVEAAPAAVTGAWTRRRVPRGCGSCTTAKTLSGTLVHVVCRPETAIVTAVAELCTREPTTW
jgi:hypothetical protein